MSLPHSHYDPRRVCLNPFPALNISLPKYKRSIGIYIAGGLFALANWLFFDAAILSAHAHSPYGEPERPPPVHVSFVDWVPGICSLLGMLVINLIDKDRVRGDEGFGDSRAVWRARLFLFVGFALMAGGLAGSVSVLVLKYILHAYTEQYLYYGYANVSQNVALMLSAVIFALGRRDQALRDRYRAERCRRCRALDEAFASDASDADPTRALTVDRLLRLIDDEQNKFSQYRKKKVKVRSALKPVLDVVGWLAEVADEATATAFQPGKAVFVAVKVLVEAAHNISARYDTIIKIFSRMKGFLNRCETYLSSTILLRTLRVLETERSEVVLRLHLRAKGLAYEALAIAEGE
ncbi:hypothetical protein EVG20_g3000 [Dentipellis fragilis]|uniref:Fungal STAND N-terminal Goodbye domain-containing protein n=1 Tax=Dentipellis fragilis TaxID=205917 RepID=A0A4Y9Z5K1_9AGAM|nr:hypothetical protein EVG20_g3000 [Dentipellis fragilis]